jgi:hypothetical protein
MHLEVVAEVGIWVGVADGAIASGVAIQPAVQAAVVLEAHPVVPVV